MTPGTLFIVATPMGNLEDITYRAVRILKEADLIAAEDTRHSRKLLSHFSIDTPMTPCHDHNESARIASLLERLASGTTIALISDAGTPLISDPGYKLVRAASGAGIPVVPVPGCNAAVAGLCASGLPTDQFLFAGFLPRKQGQLTRAIEKLSDQSATLVFYESPRRILPLVTALLEILGDREACLGREITKQYEEFLRGSLSRIRSSLETRETIRGEFVLMVGGQTQAPPAPSAQDLEQAIRAGLEANEKTGPLAACLAARFNLPKREVYEAIVRLKA